MDSQQYGRWLACMAALAAAGCWLVRLCLHFRGFASAYTAPLVLGAVCLVSGCAYAALRSKR